MKLRHANESQAFEHREGQTFGDVVEHYVRQRGDAVELAESVERELAAATEQLHEACTSTHRQAFCMHQCAAHLGSDTAATIEGLPIAVEHVVKDRNALRTRVASLEGALNGLKNRVQHATDEFCTCGRNGPDDKDACNACLMYHWIVETGAALSPAPSSMEEFLSLSDEEKMRLVGPKTAAQPAAPLVVCPKAAECDYPCSAKLPHRKYSTCASHGDICGVLCPACVPVKGGAK